MKNDIYSFDILAPNCMIVHDNLQFSEMLALKLKNSI